MAEDGFWDGVEFGVCIWMVFFDDVDVCSMLFGMMSSSDGGCDDMGVCMLFGVDCRRRFF